MHSRGGASRPVNGYADEEIQLAVAVEIGKGRAGDEADMRNPEEFAEKP